MFDGNTVAEVDGLLELPLAISEITGDPTALLVNVITPVTEPAACGVNEIVTTCEVPGAKISGNVGLTIVNPVPDTVPAETVVVPFPGLDMVMDCVTVVPRTTLPKYKDEGDTFRAPDEVVLPPVAVRPNVVVGLDAFEVNDMFALVDPFAVGLKVTVKGTLLPGATVSGN